MGRSCALDGKKDPFFLSTCADFGVRNHYVGLGYGLNCRCVVLKYLSVAWSSFVRFRSYVAG